MVYLVSSVGFSSACGGILERWLYTGVWSMVVRAVVCEGCGRMRVLRGV